MGLIADLDCPHFIPRLEGRAPRVPRVPDIKQMGTRGTRPSITNDTPLVPRAAAEGVWEEACAFLDEELPREWIGLLAEKAEAIYAHGPRFRRRLRHSGDTGREWLWAFMRDWLDALLQEHRAEFYRRLPARYCVGGAIPARPSVAL